MRVQRASLVTLIAIVGLVLMGPAAFAQAPYPPGAAARCDDAVVAPGETIRCEARGFAAGAEVIVEVLGNGFSRTLTVTADAEGVASVTVQIPPEANDGRGTITFTGEGPDGSQQVASASFVVQTVPAAPADDGPIPTTGANLSNGALLALGVIVLGGSLVYGARRRRSHDVDLPR